MSRASVSPFNDLDLARLAACYGLLACASLDLGVKAEGSAKLTRALAELRPPVTCSRRSSAES
ncbi:MAG: hypothetical protein ACR2HE_03600 [Casimicrobiaceae bacterium]